MRSFERTTIHEINETADGRRYVVMAHYEGETLKERIGRGPLALDDAIDIATKVQQPRCATRLY